MSTSLESFGEHQIYRIDHYLAKETMQDELIFRFANSIFEPIWSRRYIKSAAITAAVAPGVENRAGYCDEAGILRQPGTNAVSLPDRQLGTGRSF
jgi:glucose-6-phosphate 1-dehydrogenase